MKKYINQAIITMILITPFQNAFGLILEPVWIKTKATFKVMSVVKDKINENSIIGELIDFNDRGLSYYLSDDGYTLHHYSITYSFPIMVDKTSNNEKETIVQHGLYRDLDPNLRKKFKKRNSKFTLDIEYNANDPQQFRLIYDGKHYMLNMIYLDL